MLKKGDHNGRENGFIITLPTDLGPIAEVEMQHSKKVVEKPITLKSIVVKLSSYYSNQEVRLSQ